MGKAKRPKLSLNEQLCLLAIGDHCVTGAAPQFSPSDTRRTVQALRKKKLVHWSDGRWVVTGAGYSEWQFLVMDQVVDAARRLGEIQRAGAPKSRAPPSADERTRAHHPRRRVPA